MVVGADGRFELTEDDGAGSGLDPAAVARTPITFDQATGTVTLGPASGALHCLPASRDWRISFPGLTDRVMTVMVDGAAADVTVGIADGRPGAAVAGVPVTATLTVCVGPDPTLAANDVPGRLFTMLDRAQIGFELKQRIQLIATSGHPLSVRLSHLQALGLDRPLETAVGEILLANTPLE